MNEIALLQNIHGIVISATLQIALLIFAFLSKPIGLSNSDGKSIIIMMLLTYAVNCYDFMNEYMGTTSFLFYTIFTLVATWNVFEAMKKGGK